MPDSVTTIPKQFVIVSDAAPASPFQGQLWRDTSNNVLKQWDGSQWVSVQTSPDSNTITLNSNGEIQVSKPSNYVIGDFEVDQDGFNTPFGTARDTAQAFKGSASLSNNGDTNARPHKDVDFSKGGTLVFWFYPIDLDYSNVEVRIGGSTIENVQASDLNLDAWNRIEIPVSSYTGIQELRFDSESGEWFIDYIYLKSTVETLADEVTR